MIEVLLHDKKYFDFIHTVTIMRDKDEMLPLCMPSLNYK